VAHRVSAQADTPDGVHAFAGLVAREVDKLLTLILGYTELALQDIDERAELIDDLRVVRGSTERARRLTDGLHTLSLRRALHPVHLDLSAWLPAVAPSLDRLVGPAVVVEVRANDPATVWMDPGQLEVVLAQLVGNAAAAYDGAGAVTITVRQRPGADGQGCVSIAVRDRGRGMDPATLRHCTEPMFSGSSLDARGLGLAIVRTATAQAGGELRLSSRTGRGTTATVLLPAAIEAQGSKR
jgi:two-component system cell cycle sensor histidine kinase/response regulator CckA